MKEILPFDVWRVVANRRQFLLSGGTRKDEGDGEVEKVLVMANSPEKSRRWSLC